MRGGLSVPWAIAALPFLWGASSIEAQGRPEPAGLPWSFPVGERAEYDVTFGPIKVGRGAIHVEAIDTVDTRPAYRLAFELKGGPFFYKVNDRSVSWVAPNPIRSLRFEQELNEGGYHRHRRYRLDQEAGTYTREDWDEERSSFQPVPDHEDLPMPAAALDEIAYLYLARRVPLEVGRRYEFERYFDSKANPVVLEVLRRETVRVPAGRFRTVVVRPIVKTGGLFGDEGRAEVYLSDDDRRVIVLLRSWTRAGQLNMYLRDYDPGRENGWIVARCSGIFGLDAPPRCEAHDERSQKEERLGRGKYEPTAQERARDELFSHIQRCGVLDAEAGQREEWLNETVDFLAERYPDMNATELEELKVIGRRYCSPAIPHGSTTAEKTSEAQENVQEEEQEEVFEKENDEERSEVGAA